MKINRVVILLMTISVIAVYSCKKKEGCTDPVSDNYDPDAKVDDGSCKYTKDEPMLIFKFRFDSTQQRLDNLGQPAPIPAGHAAQTPQFRLMGAHYIELSKQNDIPAYNGTMLFDSPTTTIGGSKAIDFDSAAYAGDNEEFFAIKLKDVPAATYKYLRMSLSYQNYDINFRANGTNLTGTVASFVGANTYIRTYTINNQSVTVNANKLQGYWGFETDYPGVPVSTGQAPAGATTVPNPIATTSAIPPGSCLVTGIFGTPFTITGNETTDIIVVCSISINNSFEWKDNNNNGTYEPLEGDTVVDMGVRGLVPVVQ